MKIWAISDTHKQHSKLEVPKNIDMIIHCGDGGTAKNPHLCLPDLEDFFQWYDKIDVKTKLYIPGNHDTPLQAHLLDYSKYSTVKVLIHEFRYLEGLGIFGSPWTPIFYNWAYNANHDTLFELWKDLDLNPIDLLVTHGPPYQILDKCVSGHNAGCKELKEKVLTVKPKYHLFGHIHENNNQILKLEETVFVNCSVLNENYELVNNGIILEI